MVKFTNLNIHLDTLSRHILYINWSVSLPLKCFRWYASLTMKMVFNDHSKRSNEILFSWVNSLLFLEIVLRGFIGALNAESGCWVMFCNIFNTWIYFKYNVVSVKCENDCVSSMYISFSPSGKSIIIIMIYRRILRDWLLAKII